MPGTWVLGDTRAAGERHTGADSLEPSSGGPCALLCRWPANGAGGLCHHGADPAHLQGPPHNACSRGTGGFTGITRATRLLWRQLWFPAHDPATPPATCKAVTVRGLRGLSSWPRPLRAPPLRAPPSMSHAPYEPRPLPSHAPLSPAPLPGPAFSLKPLCPGPAVSGDADPSTQRASSDAPRLIHAGAGMLPSMAGPRSRRFRVPAHTCWGDG